MSGERRSQERAGPRDIRSRQCFFHGWGVVKDQKMAVVSYLLSSFIIEC